MSISNVGQCINANTPASNLYLSIGHVRTVLLLYGAVLGGEEPEAGLSVAVYHRVRNIHIQRSTVKFILHPQIVEEIVNKTIALQRVRCRVSHDGRNGHASICQWGCRYDHECEGSEGFDGRLYKVVQCSGVFLLRSMLWLCAYI